VASAVTDCNQLMGNALSLILLLALAQMEHTMAHHKRQTPLPALIALRPARHAHMTFTRDHRFVLHATQHMPHWLQGAVWLIASQATIA
jgi:hypothetical protein